MQPIHESRIRDHQMLVPSPGCILNCQALSIHLPPLSETRDSSSQNKYLSSPMSTSPKQLRLVSPPQSHRSYQRQYSDSPTSTRSASNQPVSAKPQGPHSIGSRSEDLNCKVNTPNSCTDIDTRSSVPLSNYLQYLRECSIDELSSVAQDSPEVQQLAAGQPGIARRAKTHVPSACINCKRKHLACETKRPCNRCVQTGKESSCVDVQHKKRGRPRLREEESSRDVDCGRDYIHGENYSSPNGIISVPQVSRRRSESYRELRSHENLYSDSRPRTSDSGHLIQQQQQPLPAANRNSTVPTSYLSGSIPTALLTPDFLVARHNHAFADALSLLHSATGQSLVDLVVPSEKERIQRLQINLQAEFYETSHLPRMHGQYEGSNGMPALENLVLENRVRSEYWTFRLPNGQSRGFPITISFANDGAHFIILTLVHRSNAIILPSLQFNHAARKQPLNSSSFAHGPDSPAQDHHLVHQHIYRNSNQEDIPYPTQFSPHKSSGSDNRTLLMQPSPSVGLDQYRQPAPSRMVVAQYGVDKVISSPEASRTSYVQSQNMPGGNLRHLQLPPIRTTGTGISEQSQPSDDGKVEHLQGKQSPAKESPQSGRKKKRRRVEIGDMLH